MLEHAFATTLVERSESAPWGLAGGDTGRANRVALRLPGGERTEFAKATRLAVPKGATLELMCGGGGGYGPPAERDVGAVLADVREGYISEAHARKHYPHAFVGPGAAACLDTR